MTKESNQPGRSIELEIEVPGTVDEVWDAIATGPGITSWFIPMEVDEHAGGEVRMDWGSFGIETADVEVWDAPHRFVFRGRTERALAYEWLVEARDGGSCVVRLVNTGFGDGEDWDEQYHSMSDGWKLFLEHLRLYRTHFAGSHARAFIPTVSLPGPHDEAWAALCSTLGIPDDAAIGDRIATTGDVPPLAGTIESIVARPTTAYLLLVDEPAAGTAFVTVEGEGDQVAASVYLYLHSDDDNRAAAGEPWVDWMNTRFTPMGEWAELQGN